MKMKLKPLMIFLATYLFALILFVALSWMLHPDLEQPLIGALWVIGGALVCHHLLLIGYTKALKIHIRIMHGDHPHSGNTLGNGTNSSMDMGH
jgi:hypothetical protein